MSGLSYQPGHVIGDRYRLESKLGEGGMGAVWRAEHVALKSPVAIKFINPGIAANEDVLNRFMLEARSSAALRSTHIVQVFDFGVDSGVPYIAMELLHGESLGARLERVGRLSPGETARVMGEVARAVEYAHAAGVVHRDLKPDNIFLVREGSAEIAKVLDFGIAKVTGGELDATTGSTTRTGAILGTPFYVSPEQARGNKRVDHRSDLWALGVITYQCLLGSLPFVSDGLGDLLMKICGEPHPQPSSVTAVPVGFDQWVARALAKEPDARFQSAGDMFLAFGALVGAPMSGDISGPFAAQMPHAHTPSAGTQQSPHAQTPSAAALTSGSLDPTSSGISAAGVPKRGAAPVVAAAAFGAVLLLGAAGGGAWWFFGRSSATAEGALESASSLGAPSAPQIAAEAQASEPPSTPTSASAMASSSPEVLPQDESTSEATRDSGETKPKSAARAPQATRTVSRSKPATRTKTAAQATVQATDSTTTAAKSSKTTEPAPTKPRSGVGLFDDRR